ATDHVRALHSFPTRRSSDLGTGQVLAKAQTLNPSASEAGAEGVASGAPLESTSWTSSEDFSLALAPLTVARSKLTVDRLGSGANPPLVPMMRGVSSIHSAVPSVEG